MPSRIPLTTSGIMITIVVVRFAGNVRVDRAVGVSMDVFVHFAFDPDFALPTAAGRAHAHSPQSTSSSLTRISVPPVTCTW